MEQKAVGEAANLIKQFPSESDISFGARLKSLGRGINRSGLNRGFVGSVLGEEKRTDIISSGSDFTRFRVDRPTGDASSVLGTAGIGGASAFGTLGDISARLRRGKVEDLISEFRGLTPEQAETKALAGERGFVGQSTLQGPLISFDVSRFDKDITAAGSLGKVREQLGTGGLISAGIRSGFTGAGRFGLGAVEFVAEDIVGSFGSAKITEGRKRGFFGGGIEIAAFDQGIFGKAKQLPSDPVQLGTQVALTLGLGGPSALRTVRLARTKGVGTALGGLAGELSVVRPKPGVFTPSISTEPIKIDKFTQANIQRGKDVFSVAELRGTGRQADINLRSTGARGRDQGFQITDVDVPFIEIGRGGRVTSGRLREIRFDKPPTQRGPVQDRFGTLDLTKDVGLPFRTRTLVGELGDRSFAGELPLRKARTKAGTFQAEEFIAGFGDQPVFTRGTKISRFEGLFGRGGARRTPEVRLDGFFAGVSGKGRRLTIRLPETADVSGFRIPTGGKRPGPRTALRQDFAPPVLDVSRSLRNIQKSISTPRQVTPSIDLVGPGAFPVLLRQPSAFAGTGQFELTQEVAPRLSVGQQRSQQLLGADISRDVASFTGLGSLAGQGARQRPGIRFGTGIRGIQQPVSAARVDQIIGTTTRTTQDVVFDQFQDTRRPARGRGLGFGTGFDFTGRGFGFLPALPPSPGIFEGPSRRARGKRKFRRTPSLISVLRGIQETPALGSV